MIKLITISSFLLFALSSCDTSSSKIELLSPNTLEYTFASSLYPPFNSDDTLVFEHAALFCGATTQDEIDRTYIPKPDTIFSSEILQKNFKGRFLNAINLSTINNMDTLADWEAKSNAYYKDKIRISFWGDILSKDSVMMHERYTTLKNSYHVDKLFTFNNKTWMYKTQYSGINSEKE